jgi:hypothetical protein
MIPFKLDLYAPKSNGLPPGALQEATCVCDWIAAGRAPPPFACCLLQIVSWALRNRPSLRGQANSRLGNRDLIHQPKNRQCKGHQAQLQVSPDQLFHFGCDCACCCQIRSKDCLTGSALGVGLGPSSCHFMA